MKGSDYLKYPLLPFVLGTQNLKSGILTALVLSVLSFLMLILKKVFREEKMFFFRFLILSMLITLVSLGLNYLSLEWYIENKIAVLMFFSIFVVTENFSEKGKGVKIKFLLENILFLLALGMLRELLSFGKVLNVIVLKNYEGILIFNYTAGGLLLTLFLIACYNKLKNKQQNKQQGGEQCL